MNSVTFELNSSMEIVDLYQAMSDRLTKIQSLINIALNEQLFNQMEADHQHYLWVITDLVEETKKLSDALLKSTEMPIQP